MIDTSALRFPKPGHASGRLVLSGQKYSRLKRKKWQHQAEHCSRCSQSIPDPREAPLHHPHGRGIGGGKRDDRDTELLCQECHQAAAIERRESWMPADETKARP